MVDDPRKVFVGRYEIAKKKGLNHFRDISVCHGNLLIIPPALIENRKFAARIEKIYHARKSSIRSALAVGLLTGLGYLFGVHLFKILSLDQFARLASLGFNVGLVPVLSPFPEIAVDIDEARDYQFIMEELNRKRQRDRKSA